jgi:cation diffusion facilitator family transporter
VAAGGSRNVVLVALAANFAIAVAKFVAAAWTRSSAMLSEAIHSLVDTSNQALLLYGLNRARLPADARHPFGYSREIYFWSFVVAVLLFSMGAGVSIYEGIEKLRDPHPISDFWVNYIVLGIALMLEGLSAYKAITQFESHRGPRGWLAALRASKDAALFTVLLEDVAAVSGLLIAFVALLCVQLLGWQQADAVASILIGMLLATVAAFMSVELRSLIVGEAVSSKVLAGIERILKREVGARGPLIAINEIRTMHLGPEDVLVAASVDAIDGIPAEEVERVTSELERAIKVKYPEVRRLYIETQSVAGHAAAVSAERKAAKPKAKSKTAAPAGSPSETPALPGKASEPSRKARKRSKKQRPESPLRPPLETVAEIAAAETGSESTAEQTSAGEPTVAERAPVEVTPAKTTDES